MTVRPTIVLDLTRTASRVGRGPATGIDRVERAWLSSLLTRDLRLCGIVRISSGYVWLDREGCRKLLDRIEGRVPCGPPDGLSLLSLKLAVAQRAFESDLRRISVGRAFRGGLAGLLEARMPEGALYLNLGHSHLEPGALAAFARRGRVAVMLHDAIPLELPATQRPGMPEAFAERVRAVARHAGTVLVPSRSAAAAVRPYLKGMPVIVTPLGVTLAEPAPDELPDAVPGHGSYMVVLGTIDPRKNQALLIEIWRQQGHHLPHLFLIGARGWGPGELHRQLDDLPAGATELPGLSDGAVAALLCRAVALLHPSLAEGFGLPPLEAALRGTPVIASDISAIHETLGDVAVYAAPGDRYQWSSAIRARAEKGPPSRAERDRAKARLDRPTWETHLNLALERLRY